jgi:hypothetical protein
MHKSKCKASQQRLRKPWALSLRRKRRTKVADQDQKKAFIATSPEATAQLSTPSWGRFFGTLAGLAAPQRHPRP